MKTKNLLEGELYTVTRGRFKGLTGRAYETAPWACHALLFPGFEDGISFLDAFDSLRKATLTEQVGFILQQQQASTNP